MDLSIISYEHLDSATHWEEKLQCEPRRPLTQIDTRLVQEAGDRKVAPGTPLHALRKRLRRANVHCNEGDENLMSKEAERNKGEQGQLARPAQSYKRSAHNASSKARAKSFSSLVAHAVGYCLRECALELITVRCE